MNQKIKDLSDYNNLLVHLVSTQTDSLDAICKKLAVEPKPKIIPKVENNGEELEEL